MSIMYNGALVAGTPEVSTTVQAGDARPVTSGAVNTALSGKQAKVTASGVLIGDGAGGVTAKTLDTYSLTNDSNHIPSSSVVKSALNSKANADSIAIVADGNTHIAITAGQYVYVKNHSTLVEGLYKSKSNISANATLSGSNLTSISDGGLNQFLLRTSENPLDGRLLASKGLTLSEFCGLYEKTDANGIVSFSLSSANSQALSGYGGTGFGFAKRIDSTGSTLLYFVLFQPAAHRITFGNIDVSTQAVTLYGTYDFTT